MVWFSSQIVLSRTVSPFPNEIDDDVYVAAEKSNFIDNLVLDKLKELRLAPSPPTSDSEFLRRAFLDTIGTLPTEDEVISFFMTIHPTNEFV